jgi:hypothetical protein
MRANSTIVVFAEVAIKAKNLEFVSGGEVVTNEPHIQPGFSDFLAMLSTIVVNVVDCEKSYVGFTTASAFSSKMANNCFFHQSSAFFAVLAEISPNASGVLIAVSFCNDQHAGPVFLVVFSVYLGQTVLAAAFIIANVLPKIELKNGLFLFT